MKPDFTQMLQDATSYAKMSKLKSHVMYPALVSATNFLTNPTITQRWWHANNNVWSIPTCKMCCNVVTWRKETKEYGVYCSAKCAQGDPDLKQKKEQTFIARYGVKTGLQSAVVKEKTRAKLEELGVTNVSQLDAVKAKVKQTTEARYQGLGFGSDATRQKINATNIAKYGSIAPATSDVVKCKIRQSHQSAFGCHPQQRHISEDALLLLEDRDWLIRMHHIEQRSLSHIAQELGIGDTTTVKNRLDKFNIELKYWPTSIGERELGDFIESLGCQIIRNDRRTINPQELDVFVPDVNIAFEYCGLYWHSDKFKDPLYHYNKFNMCREAGVALITIFEDEWIHRQFQVKRKIAQLLKKAVESKVGARKCSTVTVPFEVAADFLNNHHIQGRNRVGNIRLGLECDGELVALLTCSKHDGGVYYIQRYATACQVQGGFTKLLSEFKRQHPDWTEIITFADNRWSTGELYSNNGFTLDKAIAPDYTYSADGHSRSHKFNYRRAHLPKLLPEFDPELTEMENCDRNNILRIWDCGKGRYIIRK